MNMKHVFEKLGYEKEIRRIRFHFYFSFYFIALMFFILAAIFILQIVNMNYYGAPHIDLSNLDEDNQEYALDLIRDIDPVYLMFTKKIIFYDEPMDLETNEKEGEYIVKGEYSKFSRTAWIVLSGYEDDKITLCHELAHSFVHVGKSHFNEHTIVNKLEEVCYDTNA